MNSKSKKPASTSIRVFGQRSIDSTFHSLPSNPTSFNDSERNARNELGSRKSQNAHVSLSNFLDRKLPKSSSILSQTVQGKSTPFLSPLGLRIPTVEQTIPVVEEKRCGNANDQRVFERFKQTEEKEDFVGFLCADELENSVSVADESQESRKRKNPFEGGIQSQTVRNNVVVLGGESKFKQKGQKAQIEINSSNKKPKPLYNHYANGRGWWDYDMEGVDNEELGFSEVWEGVGSTTLGGIADWH
ncbi:uncharacterized protein LOC107466599 isoform X1 [Arachis duranensis]|uniref:Uncharacterized protein LOC107466599 isoform X1 n=1 Tax=Arachis duranensis TaxID=130453 RepID=A0A6P4BPL6_ARADU|nr:uncharacterized protein LOC107466599 isoform X1 [Arachis duranensis]XP_025619823.1 uncharacterized protein LOC112711397 isoform X1 [Arachis hypogaea]XP_057735905.1 uncharacterized protein LOC130951274 isoform X1 [Arachis stenosperma]